MERLLIAVLGIWIGGGCGRELRMIDKTAQDQAVKRAAAKDHGWDPGDVQVGVVSRLDRNGCTFFRATNTAQKDRQPAEYVVLPSGKVVGAGAGRASGAATVLRACGEGAPADWWAQVITRFSGQVRGVVVAPETAPSALRKIRESGGEWSPPKLVTTAGSTTVTFYTIHYEEGAPYEVKAALSSAGALTVDTRKLVPASRG